MKTVQEAAKQHVDSCKFKSDFPHHERSEYNGFLAGAKFVQRWIPVEEELPPSEKKVLCKNTVDGEGVYTVATYYVKHKRWITPIHMGDPNIEYTPEFWRPINIE